MIKTIKKNQTTIILLFIILLSSIWMITEGISNSHDIYFHCGRIIGLSNSIKDGDYLALIHNYFYGLGYANGLFYSNFYLYIPALLHIIGLKTISSLKVLYLLINIGTTISIYYSLNSIIKDKKVSIIGTILYMFSNYRLVDIYARGALGEILAFMIIPIVLLGLYEIIYRDYKKWYIFTIGFVLLLLCHLITTMLLGIFTILIIIISYKEFIKDKQRIKYLIISGIIGLLLGCFFLLPIIEQKLYGNISVFEIGSSYIPKNQTVKFIDLLISKDFFNTSIGFVLILLLPIRLFIKKDDIKEKNIIKFADILYILGIIACISTTKIFPWNKVDKVIEIIQFPWRLLVLATPFLVISYTIYYKELKPNKKIKIYMLFMIIISILEILIYTINYSFIEDHIYYTKEDSIGLGEYLLKGTDLDKLEGKIKVYTSDKNIEIKYKRKGMKYTIKYKNNNKKESYIEIPMFNYYGYKAIGEAKLVNGNNNLIRLNLSKTKGEIKVYYHKTKVQIISLIISLITAINLTIYIIKKNRSLKEN